VRSSLLGATATQHADALLRAVHRSACRSARALRDSAVQPLRPAAPRLRPPRRCTAAPPLAATGGEGFNPLQALQDALAGQNRSAARTRAKAALRTAIAGCVPAPTFVPRTDIHTARMTRAGAHARSTERGLLPGPAGGRAAVEAAVDALAVLAAEDAADGRAANTDASRLSATWRLLWTSERETLFLLEKGLPFLGAAGESYQACACCVLPSLCSLS
jgi:hypothetical protein